MRLMHLVLRPRFSGAEMLAKDLSILQQQQKHQVCFAAIDFPSSDYQQVLESLSNENISVMVPKHETGRIGRLRHLFQTLKKFKPDVVFAHSQIPMYYASVLHPFFSHGLIKVIHNASGEKYGIIDKTLTPIGTHVIGVNKDHLDVYAEGSRGKVIPHFIPNGIQLKSFRNAIPLERPVGRKLAVQVGRICDMKGQLNSIEALIRLKREDVDFWVAGIEEDKKYTQKMLEMAKFLPGNFLWLGGRNDVPQILATADVIFMPSAYEAHPIAYLEALASGKAIVANTTPILENQGKFEGVYFAVRENNNEFSEKIDVALSQCGFFDRDLDRYDIALASGKYIDIAEICVG